MLFFVLLRPKEQFDYDVMQLGGVSFRRESFVRSNFLELEDSTFRSMAWKMLWLYTKRVRILWYFFVVFWKRYLSVVNKWWDIWDVSLWESVGIPSGEISKDHWCRTIGSWCIRSASLADAMCSGLDDVVASRRGCEGLLLHQYVYVALDFKWVRRRTRRKKTMQEFFQQRKFPGGSKFCPATP